MCLEKMERFLIRLIAVRDFRNRSDHYLEIQCGKRFSGFKTEQMVEFPLVMGSGLEGFSGNAVTGIDETFAVRRELLTHVFH